MSSIRLSAFTRVVVSWVLCHFPERQIYVRAQGHVTFYIISTRLQLFLAGFTTIALLWTTFVTVNVVFKDRIIEAKQYRYERSQANYETRLAALTISYDELLTRAGNVQAAAARRLEQLRLRQQSLQIQPSIPVTVPAEPISDSAKMREGGHILGLVQGWLGRKHLRPFSYKTYPSLAAIVRQTALIHAWAHDATNEMSAIEHNLSGSVEAQKAVIARTGIDTKGFLRRISNNEGMGGPEIPLETIRLPGISDLAFTLSYLRAEANLSELAGLQHAIGMLPTALPIAGKPKLTSGFGPRIDPFTGQQGFHAGIDFAGRPGSPVLATAAGQVIFAGPGGGYGNMVLLNHGFGLRTRYAHLMKILVVPGQHVTKGMAVGELGSTGRSTGPHVHYEVMYDETVRNPKNFFCLFGCGKPSLR
jgi:murein DD-endopeptidase MepM/ murein hydrolase activator NlpD